MICDVSDVRNEILAQTKRVRNLKGCASRAEVATNIKHTPRVTQKLQILQLFNIQLLRSD